MHFTIITLFPEMFSSVFASSIIKRACEDGKLTINIVNLRDFGEGKHKIVDDTPYGGGTGMVLKVDVVHRAILATKKDFPGALVALMDPSGTVYTQQIAEKLAQFEHLIILCGHYEGFDHRIREYVDFEISIGDYVLSGGEIPAMVICESVARLVTGVLKKSDATKFESFSENAQGRILEAPHYTRPRVYEKKEVPEVLLSGNPKEIDRYRIREAQKRTKEKRPDIIVLEKPEE
jgi:tRNA (guanine37-N1)-methyltransferase